jgi:hypothetical protein
VDLDDPLEDRGRGGEIKLWKATPDR